MYIVLLSLILIIVILICYFNWKIKDKKDKFKNSWLEENIGVLNDYIDNERKIKIYELNQELEKEKKKHNDSIHQLEEQSKHIQEALRVSQEHHNQLLNNEKELLDKEIGLYRSQGDERLRADYENLCKELSKNLSEFNNSISVSTHEAANALTKTLSDLKDYEKMREAANEAMRREQEIEEKQDFYRVCLSEEDKMDIELIKSLMPKINNRTALNKLIWDVYVKKAVAALVKNVLDNKEISGIYKFTHIKSGKVYVGRTSRAKTRATEHYKSAFDLSSIASSAFHAALKKYGVDAFTFEILEECPKEMLSEREKYWIGFYESDIYGWNERRG